MNAIMQHTKKPLIALTEHEGGPGSCASMVSLAALLQRCGTEEVSSKELISFVNDVDEETGEITTVKVVL